MATAGGITLDPYTTSHEEESLISKHEEHETQSRAATPFPHSQTEPRKKKRKRYRHSLSEKHVGYTTKGVRKLSVHDDNRNDNIPQQHNVQPNPLLERFADGSRLIDIPLISRETIRFSQFAIHHRKTFNCVVGLIILFCLIVIVAIIMVTLIHDSKTNDNTALDTLTLAPFTVFKHKINSVFYYQDIDIKLDPECKYSGLIQVLAGRKLTKVNKTIERKFKTLSVILPDLINCTISCEKATNISLELKNVPNKMTICKPDEPIDLVEIYGRKEDGIVTITRCDDLNEDRLTAQLSVETYDLKNEQTNNLNIGENNSTTIFLSFNHRLEYLYLSTKYVQANHEHFDEIIVHIEQKSKTIMTLSFGVSGSIALLLLLMIILYCGINTCRKRQIVYFTVVVQFLKQ